MKSLVLNNGLSVLFHQMKNTHSITLGLYVKAGSCYEKDSNNGITHLLEHMHFRELGKYTQEHLYYKMESIGSTLQAVTYRDFVKFTMKVIPEKVCECIDIYKELLTTKMWSYESLEKEKKLLLIKS